MAQRREEEKRETKKEGQKVSCRERQKVRQRQRVSLRGKDQERDREAKAEGREGKMKGRKLQGNKQGGKGCWMLEVYFSAASRLSVVMQRPGNHSSACLLCRAQNETKCLPTKWNPKAHMINSDQKDHSGKIMEISCLC